eukprot:4769832-Heterocapsa_arctica.AAC.1
MPPERELPSERKMPPEREKSHPVLSAPWEPAGKTQISHVELFGKFIWPNRFRYLYAQGKFTRLFLARQQR